MTNMFKGAENDKPTDDEPMDVQDSVQPVYTGPILENMLTGDAQTEGKTAQEIIDEDACRAEATFQFKLERVSKFRDQALSPPCIVRNLPWKMLLMHRQTQTPDRGVMKTLGFFLQCNGESDSTSWSCNASAKLRLKKQTGDGEDFVRGIAHLFFHKENDWGFSNFVPISDLLDQSKGWLKDDSIILEVDVCADAPHGVSWDSKKHTGYVGLKNQGATCYMNSLLQTLYFTNKLRKAVYQMPTEAHDPGNNVALALQRVFFDLQTHDKPVGTKKLTKSFGWETLDSFMQHDVQELCRVLLDNMESKMKGTCVDGTIPELFKGTMLSYIKCKDVEYVSEREEPFYDIQLNIKEKKDVCESFEDYCTVETLDGDNKYDAGPHGLQDAEKGVIFIKLPPVLHLQLMRFQYDPMTDTNIKVNDRFEFQEEIDLTKYLKYPAEDGSKCIYRLHAVLVHSGDNHGGHYVGYIDPKGDGKWCKFDDDVVSRCTTKEAIDRNFGGHDDDISAKHSTNAYMLVYINTNTLDEVLHPISIEDIPESLQKKLEDERILEAQKRKEKNEAHLYMTINVFTDDVFFSHHGHDLFDSDKRPESIRPFKVKRADSINTFINMLGEAMKLEAHRLRLWPFQARQNGTYRPSLLERPIHENSKMSDVVEMDSGVTNIDVFLERAQTANGTLVEFDKNRDVCLFIKSYDPRTETLAYCGHQIFPINCSLKSMMPKLSKLAGYPENSELLMFEEVKPNMIEVIKCEENMLLEKALDELMDGDIIIIQKKEQKENNRLPTPKDYSRELYYQVEVIFLDKNTVDDTGFTLNLSQKDNYEKIATSVAEYLHIAPNMIQFFRHLGYKETAGAPIKCTFEGQLKELIPRGASKTPKKLYYSKLSIPINELENKRQIKCCYIPHKLKEEKELTLHPNKNGSVRDLLEEAKSQLELNPAGSGKLRLLEVTGFKIISIYDYETALDSLAVSNGKSLRIEEIPSDEETLPEFCRLVPVAHFHQETYSAFGVPFLIIVKDGERFSDLKDRIRKKLDVTDKEFEKYKLCVVAMGRKTYIDDESQLINIDNFKQTGSAPTRPWIGLDHINKAPKRNRPTYMEKAIKIHN